jgi:hypothetical protein
MPAAQIAVDQERPGQCSTGIPGAGRDDLWQGQKVLARSVSRATTYLWSLLDRPLGSLVEVSEHSSRACSFIPDEPGSYVLQLSVDGGGPTNTQFVILRCQYNAQGQLLVLNSLKSELVPAVDLAAAGKPVDSALITAGPEGSFFQSSKTGTFWGAPPNQPLPVKDRRAGALLFFTGDGFSVSCLPGGEFKDVVQADEDGKPVWGKPNTVATDLCLKGQQPGDLSFFDGEVWRPFPGGSEGQFLRSHGRGKLPSWETVPEVAGSLVAPFKDIPKPGLAGRRFLPTDGSVEYVDDGKAWRPLFGGVMGTTPPPPSEFILRSLGSPGTELVTEGGSLLFQFINKDAPGIDVHTASLKSPVQRLEARIRLLPGSDGRVLAGVGFRDKTTGNLELFQHELRDDGISLSRFRFKASNNGMSPVLTYAESTPSYLPPQLWLAVSLKGGGQTFEISVDGKHWTVIPDFSAAEGESEFVSPDELVLSSWSTNGITGELGGAVFESLRLE